MDQDDPSYAKILSYIDHNPTAVLGTLGEDGPYGAVVYVVLVSHGSLCFITKNQTQKYINLVAHPEVSLTFFNEKEGTTLQAKGKAYVADSPDLKDFVLDKMRKAHAIMSGWVPPVTKLNAGEFAVIGIELAYARLAEYQGLDANGPTFTEYKRKEQ